MLKFPVTLCVAITALVLSLADRAAAIEVQLANPVIIDSSPSFPGYEVNFALDGNTLTDYASLGQGTNTYITFDFGAPVTITRYSYTDRTSSGGANGSGAGGNGDNVSQYRYHHSFNDSTFGNAGDVFFLGLPSASAPVFTDNVPFNTGMTTRYLRWNVLATDGANPGAAEFQFFTFETPAVELPDPTIINSAPSFPGYEVGFVLDDDLLTDYASFGAGANTFIDFDFGAAAKLHRIDYTDRTSSGGANGSNAGGSGDNVNFYDIILSDDAIFGNADDRVYDGISVGFANTTSIFINGDLGDTARYVRFDVVQADGANVGAAEFRFFGIAPVPEPASLVLLAMGGAAAMLRRRRAA